MSSIQISAQKIDSSILSTPIGDTTNLNFTQDSIAIDSLKLFPPAKTSPLESTINYKSQDSMIFDLSSQKVYMYGNGEVTYESIKLDANFIEMNFENNEVLAKGLPDSTGKMQGLPEFEDNGDEFKATEFKYNFETKKALITHAETQQSEGFIEGKKVKMAKEGVIYIQNGQFCPCDDPKAGTYLKARKLKMIKDDKVVTGPAYLVIEEIPTPLALPFAILPNKQGKASGIIIPKPGNSPNQGFFLTDGGFYWTVNDYLDLSLTGDIYSRGSWGAKIGSNYKRRYKYGGALNLEYSSFQTGLSELPTTTKQTNFFVRWNHRQDQKARPNSTFSSSVNFGTRNNFTTNFNSSNQDYLTNTFKSNINYSYNFPNKPFNLTLNASHSQNSQDTTQVINVTLPEAVFSMQRVFPFKRKSRVGKAKWYENIGLNYTGNFRNQFSTTEAALQQGIVYDQNDLFPDNGAFNLANSQNGMRHQIPISTNLKILKHFTFSPGMGYSETWYFKKTNYEWDENRQLVDNDTINGFYRFGRVNLNANLSTNIYGMYTYRSERIKAIRHVMSPSVSFNYSPNLFDQFQTYQSDTLGNTQQRSGFESGIYGGPSNNRSGNISFNLRNNIEMKVLSKKDTTQQYKKVKIFDQFNFSSAYNIFADSLNWSPVQFNTNASLLSFLNMRINATFDPYALNADRTRTINQTHFSKTGEVARLTNFTWALSYRLNNSKKANKDKSIRPWSLDMSYNYNYSQATNNVNITQSARFNGKIMLTDNWDVAGTTNYDFRANTFSYTTVKVYRDLNCWELSFNFIPFGNRKSYTFSLNVKPALLKDLKIERRREWFDLTDN